METLVYAILFLALVALVLSGQLRVLVSGFLGVFVKDVAKTPEGAEAVYNEAIEESEGQYARANDTLQKTAGQMDTANRELVAAEANLKATEEKCERFAKNQDWEKVKLYSNEVATLRDEIVSIKNLIEKIKPALEDAKEINNYREQEVQTLRRKKKTIVEDLKRDKQLKEIYDSMDELKKTSHVSKLLDAVDQGAKESREAAVGARIVHNNKLSTQVSRANAEDRNNRNDVYVEELKAKYAKK